jgi:methylated-DNA-[protein]-cysteine S-methyltransferase
MRISPNKNIRGQAPCRIESKVFKTPFGWAGVAASEQGLCMIVLPKKDKKAVERELANTDFPRFNRSRAGSMRNAERATASAHDSLKKSVTLLQKYFSGKRVSFDLPLDTRSYTRFQQAVWKAATEVPYGETQSYAWIARKIKNPRAVRAVGQALGANPLPIIIPCHRVISSSGALCGFAGGLVMKKSLLALEQK